MVFDVISKPEGKNVRSEIAIERFWGEWKR
jgi:hypothetical protein